MIGIIIRGTPAPQGSKKFVGLSKSGRGILAESSKKVRPWRQDVKAAAEQVIELLRVAGTFTRPLDGPLQVSMTFTLPKPASAPKRRRTWPMRMPDLSKLVRSTEDALTDAGLWTDDARIVELNVRKVFPSEGIDALDSPGAVVMVSELDQRDLPLVTAPLFREPDAAPRETSNAEFFA